MGVVLPDVLPDVDDLSECVLDVKSSSGEIRTLCLSNRMSRFHYFDNGEPWHCLMPRVPESKGYARVRRSSGSACKAVEEHVRTMAAMRFELIGSTAEEAFEGNIRNCVDVFLEYVNAALGAVRTLDRTYRTISRSLEWNSVSALYVVVSDGITRQACLLGLNGGRLALYPGSFKDLEAKQFRDYAAGRLLLTDVDRLLGEARSSWQSGDYEFAFLQAVIAAEIETARTVRAECVRRGVSKTKLDDNRREMTYSWSLNIGLPLAFEPSRRPPESLVAEMNTARQRRNELMHEASFEMTRDEVRTLIEQTKLYVASLRSASAT